MQQSMKSRNKLLRKFYVENKNSSKKNDKFSLGVADVNRLLMSISTTIIRTEANTFDENSVDERKSFHVGEVPMTQTSSKSQTTSSSISKGQ